MKIIEFLGTPRAGKTEQIKRLSKYFDSQKIKYEIITDREIEKDVNIPLENALEYNLAFFDRILAKLEKLIEESKKDVIILDRGFIDGEIWFNVEFKRKMISLEEKETAINLMKKLQKKYFDFGVLMLVDPETTLKRHNFKGEVGKTEYYVMNHDYISDLYGVYLKLKEELFLNKKMLILDGTENPDELEKKIKEKVLSHILKNLNKSAC